MTIVMVHASNIDVSWPKYRHWIEDAMQYTTGMITDDFTKLLVSGKAQLWCVLPGRGAAITEIIDHGSQRIFHVFALGGQDADTWIGEMVAKWMAFAASTQCARIVASGRKGLSRLFRLHGFRTTHITGSREIESCQKL